MTTDSNNKIDGHEHKHYDQKEVINQLNMVIDDSEKMSQEIFEHLEIVLEKLDNLEEGKNLQNDVDAIKNNIFMTMSSMQAQDFHVQRIQRVVNELNPKQNSACAKHIAGDNDTSDLLEDDEIEKLIAQMGNN
ncbi:MAG: hypothetical protein U9N30_07205 [Campylobacterota bacterium]|nr:hypothetical protein [Campylobacterota bacterium]